MPNKIVARAVFGVAAAALAACGANGAPPSAGSVAPLQAATARAIVRIANSRFDPPSITVKVGTRVRFLNYDAIGHTATANSGAWSSPILYQGTSWTHAFTKAGRFKYHCKIHTYMHGTVIVTK